MKAGKTMGVSKELSECLDEIRYLLPADKVQIRRLLLDYFAAAYAGYKQNRGFNEAVRKVIFAQSGIGESTVLFEQQKLPSRMAAFMNSLYGHGAELDDGCRIAMGHVGVHVIPAVLALAEAEDKTQEEIMLAIATGYEAHIRISAAAQPGMINRSFHSTGMAGGIACAAACAKLLGLNTEGIENAMSLASTMSSGLLTYSESRQTIKPINPAKAADTGIFAARLAQAGIKGPLNFLEGPNGWFHAVAEIIDINMISKNFGHLLIHDCYFKLYPSCRHTHCGIEAAIEIHQHVRPERIKGVTVYTYPNAIKLAGQIKYPKDPDETKFSIYYTVAIALLFGEYGVKYMSPVQTGNNILEMLNKIELIPDTNMEERERNIRGATVKAVLDDGTVIESTVLIPKGDPEKPLSNSDVEKKLEMCARGLVRKDTTKKLINCISNFGGESTFSIQSCFD